MAPLLLSIALAAAGPADLVSLFARWREFQKPHLVDGVPDYTPAAMARQRDGLRDYQRRLAALDPRTWPVPQQVDYQIVRAEMNGLDFDHRVLRPWERNPDFYVTVFADQSDQPAREGPHALLGVELFRFSLPRDADELARRLEHVPALLRQARGNLTGNARDLWIHGIPAIRAQRAALADLAGKAPGHAGLSAAVQRAAEATDGFLAWVEQQAPAKTGPSGVGVENYDWYLANVQLVPYRWSDELLLMERELARSRAALALEQEKNRALPAQVPIATAEQYAQKSSAAISEYMAFLARRDVLTVREDMEPALRAHVEPYSAARPLEFFAEIDYRDPIVMRTHMYHWFDLARMEHDPHPDPIRRGALLYNIFNTRTEGFATAMEEMMMQMGLCDARPRSRELVYVMLAERAARALGELRMQANQASLDDAAKLASEDTPRGWLRLSGHTVWAEQHLYLQQPGYGTSYVIGKIELDDLLSRKMAAGSTLRQFMDEKDAAGLIPVSLLRWEMIGDRSRVPGRP